jgi:hypothetical protein
MKLHSIHTPQLMVEFVVDFHRVIIFAEFAFST